MHNLEQSVGPVPSNVVTERTAPPPTAPPPSPPINDTIASQLNLRDQPATPRIARDATRPEDATAGGGATKPEKLMQEGTAIASRRGKLLRDPAGGWMFIFDADTTGLADPPVRMLPCLLLEQLEDGPAKGRTYISDLAAKLRVGVS